MKKTKKTLKMFKVFSELVIDFRRIGHKMNCLKFLNAVNQQIWRYFGLLTSTAALRRIIGMVFSC
jgi:hypothetical protein